MAEKRFAITVSGRVQGVGYRYFTKDVADSLNIWGWVRNNPDGTVECEAQGEEEDLKEFIEKLKKGPPLSRVKNVVYNEIPVVNEKYSDFEITY
jgi:acylphosphatase